jgi:hypothetical protein
VFGGTYISIAMNPLSQLDDFEHLEFERSNEGDYLTLQLEFIVPLPWDGGPKRSGDSRSDNRRHLGLLPFLRYSFSPS